MRLRLIAPLSQTFRDPGKPESERSLATSILADYAGDQPGVLADLLMDAAPEPFAILFPKVQAQAAQAVVALKAELSKTTAADGDQEKLFQRQARAAVALVRLGQAEDVWPLLRHSPRPQRAELYHPLAEAAGDGPEGPDREAGGSRSRPGALTGRRAIPDGGDPLRSRDLAAAGARPGPRGIPGPPCRRREPLVATLLEAYRNDSDAGIHGAAEWTLRQWQQDEELKKADAGLPRFEDRGDRRWYVNSAGQTLALIEGPVVFAMGSPPLRAGASGY